MTFVSRTKARAAILCVAGIALTSLPARAQGSSTIATELASLMAARRIEAFAVQDPDAPNRFVATLLIPQVQMLVVSAEYPAPAELQTQLAQKNYRDVYAALHQPAAAASRFFLIDLGCDGLRPSGDTVDVLYEKGITQTLFNGDWKTQGLTEVAYKQRLQQADAQYARLLTLLRDGLNGAAAGTQPGR
jgi:hypothetical protein